MLSTQGEQAREYVVWTAIDRFHIRYGLVELENIIFRSLEELMGRGALGVFAEIYKVGKPVVLDWHVEEWDDPFDMQHKIRLHYRLIAVSSLSVNIPIWDDVPVFAFTDRAGEEMWKCRYCSMVNKKTATYCGELHDHAIGCGAPKELKR